MRHYGTYLGGIVHAPGVERFAPPARAEDRPRPDGRVQRACLAVLDIPRTVGDVAAVLGWDYSRAQSWVHHLKRCGLVTRTGWVRTVKQGQRAGRYQRVTS